MTDARALAGLYPTDDETTWRCEPIDVEQEEDERWDADAIEAGEEAIRVYRERLARNRREADLGPLVERHCTECGYEMRAPQLARWAYCGSTMCSTRRALVPLAGDGRADAFRALAARCDMAAARWVVLMPGPVGMALAERARADADAFRRKAEG